MDFHIGLPKAQLGFFSEEVNTVNIITHRRLWKTATSDSTVPTTLKYSVPATKRKKKTGKGHRQAILKRRKSKWSTNPGESASPTSNQETLISIRHVSSIQSVEAFNYSSAAFGKHVCKPHSLSAPSSLLENAALLPGTIPPPSTETW